MFLRHCAMYGRNTLIAIIAVIVTGLMFGSTGIALAFAPPLNQTGFDVPSAGRVIVVLKEGTFTASADAVAVKVGVKINLEFDSALNGFATTANQTQLNKLAANSNVAYIAADLPVVAAAQTPSSAVTRSAITSYAQIDGVDNAPNIGVAVLDTGVQNNHPDLRYAGGADCTGSGTDQPVAGSTGNHGTHVAGIVGAIDNSIGSVGSAPGARIWNYKVLKNVNEGFTSWIICGINAAINNPDVSVINMSLAGFNSGASSCVAGPDPLRNAVCSANDAGILMVVAAGNNGTDAASHIPAKYPEVVTVGNIADGSPVGAPGGDSYNGTSNYGSVVDISAPGTAIYSTIPGSSYGNMTGTSMASPFVAGAAALYMANTGAGASGARSWLLSTASTPMNTANGCNCAPPATGSPSRMLYLGGVTNSIPPGTQNPSFSGVKLPILGSSDSQGTGRSVWTYDNNTGTKWYSNPTTPSSASFTLDLGSDKQITGVKWKFDYIGYADSFTVRIIHSSGVSRTYGPFGNATQANTFFGQIESTYTVIRYIEFTFLNPRSLPSIGSVSEVEVWGASVTVYPPGTMNPSFADARLPVTSVTDTPSSGRAANAYDGNSGSKWYTNPPTGSSTLLRFDLGMDKEITGVKWKFDYTGYAEQFTIRIVHSSGVSRTYGPFGNATQANTFFGQIESNYTVIRYVEFTFLNPSNLSSIGSITEVEIWGSNVGGAAETNPPGAEDPTFAGTSLPIVASSDTPDTGRSSAAHDGDQTSTWLTDATTPASAVLRFDLGADTEISGIKWMFDTVGFADKFTVSIVNAEGGSRTYGPFGNATEANTFFGQVMEWYTVIRYVDFAFENPSQLTAIGSVSEVEIWGPLPNGETDIELAGASVAITCTADPASDSAALACDQNGGTNWHTDPSTPESATLTATLTEATTLTGITWNFAQQGNADRFSVSVGLGDVVTNLGEFSGGAANTYQGIGFDDEVIADRVILTFTNVDADTELGYLAEVEVWSEDVPAATPGASPDASPSPEATVEPTIDASPEASPSPEATVEPSVTEEPASPLPATATTEPTDVVEPTVEPTAAISLGTITGTDGDSVNCRTTAPDGDPITQLNEGDPIEITGEVSDGWYPVICAGEAGFIAEQFVTLGTSTPTEEGEESPTVEDTTEATTESTEEAVAEETPYPIMDTGDTENSGTAWLANDNDATTWWSLYPSQSPEQARLYLDLGSVLPIDRLTLELATWDQLPTFEIWLSEDGETWYNATPGGINGWNLDRETPVTISLGYDARFIRLVIPHVDESGLGEVGGIRQIDVWAGDSNQTQYLTSLGEPTTPTPAPVEPTDEVIEEPTEEIVEPTEVIEEPTEEVIPTDVPPTEEAPTEEPAG